MVMLDDKGYQICEYHGCGVRLFPDARRPYQKQNMRWCKPCARKIAQSKGREDRRWIRVKSMKRKLALEPLKSLEELKPVFDSLLKQRRADNGH